jgi:YHS domain-containing protein
MAAESAPSAGVPAAESDSPYSGLKLEDAPFLPTPADAPAEMPAATQPEVEASAPAPVEVPAPAPLEEPATPSQPATEPDTDSSDQFPPQPAVAVPNPAPFIPPLPDDFGGTFGGGQPQPAPSLGAAPARVADADPATPDFKPDEYLAPDVSTWSPEPMQAPDPIVAPSTARQLVATPAPTPQQTQSKIDRISARKGLSGLKGFCPVALKDHRELLDAKPDFSAVYNGRRYFFSSAAAQALFEGNPDEYVPAAMGNDVVHLTLTGEPAPGSLEHAVWFRSKLYLFATAETMETFVSAPSIHAREE